MAKVNSAASLVGYGKVPDLGWRRGGLALAKNGLPKPNTIVLNGREIIADTVQFQIRTYENRKAVYVTVGSDYREAKALLERMQVTRQREALDARLGITLPKSALELAAEDADREAKRKTLKDWVAEYIATKDGLSRHSETLYKCIPHFAGHCGKRYLEDVTAQDVTNWYNSLKSDDYAQRTCQTRYSTLRGWFKYCGVNSDTLIDSATHKRLNKKPDPQTEPYTQDELDALFAGCDLYNRVVFTLLLCTGLREQEATNLTWNQIKWKENKIVVLGEHEVYVPGRKKPIVFKTKTGKGREIPLFESLKTLLLEWRKQNPKTIFVIGTKADLPNTHLLRTLKRRVAAAELGCGTCYACAAQTGCEAWYLHKFRHTFAHRCLDKFTIHQVSKWLGHSSLEVTSIYLSGTPKEADADPFAQAA